MEKYSKLGIVLKIWSRIVGQVTGVLSTVVFASLTESSNIISAASISITLGLCWIAFDSYLRKFVANSPKKNINVYWNQCLLDLFDFAYSVSLYMIIQWIRYYVSVSDSNGSDTFSSQLIMMIASVIGFLIIVTIADNVKETEKSEYDHAHTFSRIWTSIFGTFIQFYSEVLIQELTDMPNQLFAGIITVVVLFGYIAADSLIRKFVNSFETGQRRALFKYMILEGLDFGYTISLFLFIHYFDEIISSSEDSGSSTFSEQFISIASLAIVVYSGFGILSALSQTSGGKSDSISNAARIWGRISGTVSGIFATILTTHANDSSDRNMIITVMLIVAISFPFIDETVRRAIDKTVDEQRNLEWSVVLKELLDLAYSFSFLIPLNFYTKLLLSDTSDSSLSIPEKFVATFTIAILVYCIFSVLKSIQSKK